MVRTSRRGIGLVEALILVAIVGFILAVTIPNLLQARERKRQKRTMSDMRSLGTGLGSYQVDYDGYPALVLDDAWRHLDPNYIVNGPTRDGWRTRYEYRLGPPNHDGFATSYTLTSYGGNRQSDGWQRDLTKHFDCDIIYTDGQFVQSAEGT